MDVRFFMLLFWLFVISLIAAMVQNFVRSESILSNDVFILMGICVILVLCDEITTHLNSIERIKKQVREEVERDLYVRSQTNNSVEVVGAAQQSHAADAESARS